MASDAPRPLKIFWSYSHTDEDLRDKLESHLSTLKRANRVSDWHDRKIQPGSNWRSEIDRELDSADIVLLLISAAFLDSEFCNSVELRRAIERHEKEEALVIPIMLRPCDVEGTPIEKLQQLPREGRPITKWGNRDDACQDVAKRLRIAVEEWRSRRATASGHPEPTPVSGPDEQTPQDLMLSRIFGLGRSVNLPWLRALLDRASAVARIESRSRQGQPFGTGFLVDPVPFGLEPSSPLLLSASHVITPPDLAEKHGVPPEDALIRFEIAGVDRGVKSVLWASSELRAVLLTLDAAVPGGKPLAVASDPWEREDKDNIVVIAHPRGGNLQFALQDSILLDANDVKVHYRAATEPGSSGGPVLTSSDLRVIAVHTSRSLTMPRLNGAGTYEACEGISLSAIQRAFRER